MSKTANTKTAFVGVIVLLACLQAPHAFVGEATFGARGEQAVPPSGSAVSALARNSLGMRFVEIPSGSFDMGSKVGPGEAPVHRVTVPGFWMGVTEVTQAQWQAVMGSNPSHFKQAGPDAPVDMVSWSDVQAFVAKLNALEPDRRYRLPSEAEWEYASRGASKQDPYGPAEAVAWVKENSDGTTHPVGLKQPNAFGLYDMLGNVAEWCEDVWHPDYKGAPADGSAWKGDDSQYHTLRGGGWDLPAFFIHSALRGPYDPSHRLGFRLVCAPSNLAARQQAIARQNSPALGGPTPPRDFSSLTGPYLGQTPPGPTPRIFAPNAVSTSAHELNAVFTPDGSEFYFTIQGEDRRWTIMRTALENGRWSMPRAASFSGRWSDVDLFITPDGRRLYFCSNRPTEGDAIKDFDIWVCERSGTGWSEPRNLGEPINSAFAEFYPTLTRDGTMYFQSRRPGGKGAADIWRARVRDGRYVEAECLPEPVNSSESEGDAFIAPDESYLIVSTGRGASAPPSNVPPARVAGAAAPPPPPPAGLFLSARKADGTWSALVSLGEGINLPQAGVNCQMLSPDGRYLFFTRGGDIYWVDAAVVEDAKRRAVGGR